MTINGGELTWLAKETYRQFLNKRLICFCGYNICKYGDLDWMTLSIMSVNRHFSKKDI